jgi:hypothetical protein
VVHLSREEMEAFCAGNLSLVEEGAAVRHLVFERCPECLAAAPLHLLILLRGEPLLELLPPVEEGAYDAAVDRACERALEEERRRRALQAQTERALGAVRAGRKRPKGVDDLTYVRALRARSWELRFDDPQEMVLLASLAVQLSLRLDPVACGGRKGLLDEQAEALAELGNAHRVANHFQDADQALVQARRLFEKGTRRDLLEIRLLGFEASLLGDCREFVPAMAKLKQVLEFHTRNRDRHLAGRALIAIGVYSGYAGNHEMAIWQTRQSLELIDAKRDPVLAFNAAKNLIVFLVEAGRIPEAKRLRFAYSRHLANPGGRIGEIKLRALDARIEAGLGRYQRAEAICREVIEGFVQLDLPIMAGVVALDLAAVLLRQGKGTEAAGTVLDAAEIFIAHGIRREAVTGIIMLRDAFRADAGTLAMVEEVAAFLRRLETGPASRFEAHAWAE